MAGLSEETFLPEQGDQVATVYDFLRAHETAGRRPAEPRYFLSGVEPGDQVEIPAAVYRVLRQVIEAMRAGLAVTIAPQAQRLTTQQAADLLGVSRPTLVKLLESGQIPFERVGTHRRVLLAHLLDYRQRRRDEQYAALDATAIDIDEEQDLDEVLDQLREARKAVAEHSKSRSR